MSTAAISLRLPYPPTVNHYWIRTRRGMIVGDAGILFRDTVCGIVAEYCGNPPKIADRIGLSVELMMPDRRRRDIDNTLKAICDSLEFAGVFVNDSQIDELWVKRVGVDPPGCADITVQPL